MPETFVSHVFTARFGGLEDVGGGPDWSGSSDGRNRAVWQSTYFTGTLRFGFSTFFQLTTSASPACQ